MTLQAVGTLTPSRRSYFSLTVCCAPLAAAEHSTAMLRLCWTTLQCLTCGADGAGCCSGEAVSAGIHLLRVSPLTYVACWMCTLCDVACIKQPSLPQVCAMSLERLERLYLWTCAPCSPSYTKGRRTNDVSSGCSTTEAACARAHPAHLAAISSSSESHTNRARHFTFAKRISVFCAHIAKELCESRRRRHHEVTALYAPC